MRLLCNYRHTHPSITVFMYPLLTVYTCFMLCIMKRFFSILCTVHVLDVLQLYVRTIRQSSRVTSLVKAFTMFLGK